MLLLLRSMPAHVLALVASLFLAAVCPQVASAKDSKQQTESEPTELTYLGYLADATRPRIHVRTGERTSVRLEKLSPVHYALHLPQAQIVRHVMSLPLETSCFSQAVERIEPEPQEEPNNGTVLNIRLRQRATLKVTQRDQDIFVSVAPAAPARVSPRPTHHQ